MAAESLFHGFLGFFFLLASISEGEAGNQISLVSLSVDNDNDSLIVTVIYGADYQPQVQWLIPKFRPTGGMENMDFQQTDTFRAGQGQTIMKIQHEVARTQNPKVFLRLLVLRNQDNELEVSLPPFEDLISHPPSTQSFHNLALIFYIGDKVLDPGEDLILSRYRTLVTAKLTSPELAKFDVNDPWVSHMRFEYAPGDFPVQKKDYGVRDNSPFRKEDDWTGNSTAKELDITLWRTPGILTLYYLKLKPLPGVESIVSGLEFRQNLYLLREPGEEPVRRNTVFIKNQHSHYLTEFDMPMSLHAPEFSFTVVGNPLPQASLSRACSEMGGSEVEMFETRVWSRYEVTYFFRFLNATEATAGSYNVAARSGTMEAREIMSLGIYRPAY